MEGRFQLALSSLTEEEKAAIKAHLPHLPPTVNWAEAEAKLRESIAANAAFLDGYLTLAYLLIKAKKYVDAKEVILKGLQQMVTTKSDEQMAAEMKTLQVRINSLVPQWAGGGGGSAHSGHLRAGKRKEGGAPSFGLIFYSFSTPPLSHPHLSNCLEQQSQLLYSKFLWLLVNFFYF